MENIKPKDIVDLEKELLKGCIRGKQLRVSIWEENSANITDSEELKLVILNKEDKPLMESITKNKGQTPRVYRNTIFFLYPTESEKPGFVTALKRKIAYENIEHDKTVNLSEDQKKDVKKEIKKSAEILQEAIHRYYRSTAIPDKEGLRFGDLGVPTYGEERGLDDIYYDKLRANGDILANIAALVIKEKYLTGKDYVSTEQLYQASLKTPGEKRIVSPDNLKMAMAEGIVKGLFGLGEMEQNKPVCHYFKEKPSLSLSGSEVLIVESICQAQMKEKVKEPGEPEPPEGEEPEDETDEGKEKPKSRDRVHLKFVVPKGKVSNIMGVMNLLQSKFDNLEIEIVAADGEISELDFEDKIKETFRQLGIQLKI
ncbi:MAG: DUF499 domain-containing protein [Thermoplasmata archaeon]|nr:DUF499 domain-containing protein [Thermoplasmata archaeon]